MFKSSARIPGAASVGWTIVVTLILTVSGCSTSSSTNTANSATCPTYDSSILGAPTLLPSLDPATNMPAISQMPSMSDSLGTQEKLPPTWYTQVSISQSQQEAICAKHLTAVYMDWAGVPFNQAIRWGITNELAALGIKPFESQTGTSTQLGSRPT
jgi:hypothetical protein